MSTLFGTPLPVVLAPMAGGPTTPALVIAVCGAGGLGSLAGGYSAPDAIRAQIREVRAKTDRPFAVNLFVPGEATIADDARTRDARDALAPYRLALGLESTALDVSSPSFDAQLAVLIEERVPFFSFTFGIPHRDALDACRRAGITTIGTATSVAEARALEAAGVDVICAQGAEAGGHRGGFLGGDAGALIGTTALVPAIVDAVRRPVIAAGGIMDGRGVAAALALGASAVQLGTAFLRCAEAGTSAPYRDALARADETSTTITRAFTGKPARGLANRFAREMERAPVAPYPLQHALTRDLRAAAARAGDAELLSLWAGQGVARARELPAAEIVASIAREAGLIR
ncbi:NAD(P)H-dependent flavin oxidoreductase [Sandaracinus amylolyticus]|uniref:NAD(P)H-dependent flavin oxidoreductase n=1 Tax=Sandaracinus amylolyticus TaxID=927083 RepID=UPI001F1EAD55|nr:nitronate monooxygenase [Sandaracinus amylolyticus]UJR81391.1 Enoyl-acyl-carrier-proteinreductase FMN [Sandaracinus amylolyticus]